MKLKAYAKINLTLDIVGKREDGFHLLDTVMQSVSLWDDVELTPAKEPGIRLRCDRNYLPTNTKNTACKAADLFFSHCGIKNAGLEISLKKRIPTRAGMGGGSADAATVLLGMNRLYRTDLKLSALLELGAKVGADVPFCIQGGTCRCKGTGELIEPASPMPNCFLVICKPPAGMSTPKAYALLDTFPPSRSMATPKMLEALKSGSLRDIGKSLANRFDETMKLIQVKEIKKVMSSAGALGTMMTGSGSAVYGIFQDRKSAENCRELLVSRGRVFLVRPQSGSQI